MTFRPINPKFGETGARSPFTDTKKRLGWIEGEPPPHAEWNDLTYTDQTAINDAGRLASNVATAPPQSGLDEICAGIIWSNWAQPDSGKNYLDTSQTIIDSCVGRNYLDVLKPAIYILTSGGIRMVTGCWKYEDSLAVGTPITFNFPSTPDDYYGMCSDGANLYVVWSVTGGNYRVSCFSLQTYTGNASWSADLGVDITVESFVDTIAASATQIAVALSGNGVVGSSPFEIFVIDKLVGSYSSGTGSYGSETALLINSHNSRLVSDGSHVFWIQKAPDGATDSIFYLFSASLSTPASSSYSTVTVGTFVSATTSTHPKGIRMIGGVVVAFTNNGRIHGLSPSEGDSWIIGDIDNFDFHNPSGGEIDNVAGFDGLNFWATSIDTFNASNGSLTAYKVPGGMVNYRTEVFPTPRTYDLQRVRFNNEAYMGDSNKFGNLLFDGRDMWLVIRGGDVFRISNPGGR